MIQSEGWCKRIDKFRQEGWYNPYYMITWKSLYVIEACRGRNNGFGMGCLSVHDSFLSLSTTPFPSSCSAKFGYVKALARSACRRLRISFIRDR